MGFKDAEWATTTRLPMKDKVVLIAVCLRTNDRTHQTFVGQQTIADMLGASRDKVGDALGVLTREGVIIRERRNTKTGHRTSDLITVNTAYAGNLLGGESPSRQTPTRESSPGLGGDLPKPMPEIPTAKEITQLATQEITQTPEEKRDALFEVVWKHWPRTDKKKPAREKFARLKASEVQEVARAIVAHGDAHTQHTPTQYVPHLVSWLNQERWTEQPPAPRKDGRQTNGQRNLAYLQDLAARENGPKEISA